MTQRKPRNPLAGYQAAPIPYASDTTDPTNKVEFSQAVAGARYAGAAYEAQTLPSLYAQAGRYTGLAYEDAQRKAQENRPGWMKFLDDFVVPDNLSGSPLIGPSIRGLGTAYVAATENAAQGASWGLSALPGGIKTLDWDTAGDISPGRVRVAMGVERSDGKDGYYRAKAEKRAAYLEWKQRFDRGEVEALLNPVDNPDGVGRESEAFYVPNEWDINNPADEAWLFGNSPRLNDGQELAASSPQDGAANLVSGATDALFSWYLDPLVVGGKAIKIARFGSDMLNIAGATHRSTSLPKVVESIGFEADEAGKFWSSGGEQGTKNAMYQMAEQVANNPGYRLANEEWVRTSPYADRLMGIADNINDVPTALTFIAAGTGNARYIAKLRTDAASVHDALSGLGKADPYEYVALNAPLASVRPPVLDDLLESNRFGASILDDLVTRDEGLQQALALIDSGFAPIQSVGGKIMPLGAQKAGLAWRAGKAERDFAAAKAPIGAAPRPAGATYAADDLADAANAVAAGRPSGGWLQPGRAGQWTPDFVNDRMAEWLPNRAENPLSPDVVQALGAKPGAYETTYKLSAGFRKVKMWHWINAERGSGWITSRGATDGESSKELGAALGGSVALRKQGSFLKDATARWLGAVNSTDRLVLNTEIEHGAIHTVADYYGVERDLAMSVWGVVNHKRDMLIKSFTEANPKTRAFAVDPDTGDLIYVTPMLRSQLESSIPMIDFRLLDQTIKRLSKIEDSGVLKEVTDILTAATGRHVDEAMFTEGMARFSQRALWVAEGVNSAWKASVLFRLGYTQRNVLEGWLRTWAVLGTVPALRPSSVVNGIGRTFVTNPYRKYKAGQITGTQGQLSVLATGYRGQIATLKADRAAFIRLTGGMPSATLRSHAAARAHIAQIDQEIADTTALVDDAEAVATTLGAKRGKYSKKYIGWDEAFGGEYGELRRMQASAIVNQENFFRSKAGREADYLRLNSSAYDKLSPDAPQYFDELAQAGVQMRADDLGQMALRGASEQDMIDWIGSAAARKYVHETGLLDQVQREARAKLIYRVANAYYPTPEARAWVARSSDEAANGSELKALLGGRDDLAEIHGREVDDLFHFVNPYRAFVNWAFKWLGNMPESALVRQPFYNEVWTKESARLYEVARRQGMDMNDRALLESIQQTAHRRSLKMTNETLFTIVRYSNPAATMRFLSPFFAAWENSIRTWTRIIVKDPSVGARAAILWNLPNRLGMVVDSDGNKVEGSYLDFMTGSGDQYIVLPAPLADMFQEQSGGLPFKVPKGSFNVVSPGETPFLAGFGPAVTAPVGAVLAQMPDQQEFLRGFLGDQIYNQFAPFGQASGDLIDTFAPAAARKAITGWMGEGSPDYIKVMDAITVDMLVEWRMRGGDPSMQPKAAEIKQRADDFFKFGTIASLTLPVAITRMSAYQPMIDYWRQLNANSTIPYREKVAQFTDKWGDTYLPLIYSNSRSEISGLDPTMNMFDALNDYSSEIEQMTADFGPDGPSILAATVADGPFAGSVYNWYQTTQQPGANGTYKRPSKPGEVIQQNQLRSMWTEYLSERDKMMEGLTVLGVKSLNTNAARDAGFAEAWESYQSQMAKKYGDVWDAYGPNSGGFQRQLGEHLTAVNSLLRNDKFMKSDLGRSPVWGSLNEYMTQRKLAADAYRKGGADKQTIQGLWTEWSANFRFSSLKFSDFWDQYLADDDLTVELG